MVNDVVEEVAVVAGEVIPTVVPDLIVTGAIHDRAVVVKESLEKIKLTIEDDFIDMCFLIGEARDGEYHKVWGYERFDAWIENGSGLEISARQGYYFANIAKKAGQLGLTKEDLKAVRSSSKLKEIFSLESASSAEIKGLLEAAKSESLSDIKKKVGAVKNPAAAAPPSFMTLKLEAEVKECVDDALALARLNYGEAMTNGDVKEISISKCMELICTSYLQDPNNGINGQVAAPAAPSLI